MTNLKTRFTVGFARRGFGHNVVGYIGPAKYLQSRPGRWSLLGTVIVELGKIEPSTIVVARMRPRKDQVAVSADRPQARAGAE